MEVVETLRTPIMDTALNDEGYLVVTGVAIARPGVFPYLSNGMLSQQAKLPEELFSEDTIASANGKPVTNDHPNYVVTADNIKDVAVGMTMNDAQVVDDRLRVSLIVTDPTVIQAVLDGKQELSIGFTAEIIPEFGEYMGVPYDYAQRNMRINHVAIVDKGRAGSEIALQLDSADDVYILDVQDERIEDMKKIVLDGQEIDLTAEDAQAQVDARVEEIKSENKIVEDSAVVSGLQAQVASAEGERDTYKAQVAQLKQDHADLEAGIAQKVQDRMELEKKARAILGDSVELPKTDREIKEKVVEAGGVKLTEDASDEYVDGAFNTVSSTFKGNSNIDWSKNRVVGDENDELATLRAKRLGKKED